jgi:hypothetical protein
LILGVTARRQASVSFALNIAACGRAISATLKEALDRSWHTGILQPCWISFSSSASHELLAGSVKHLGNKAEAYRSMITKDNPVLP